MKIIGDVNDIPTPRNGGRIKWNMESIIAIAVGFYREIRASYSIA